MTAPLEGIDISSYQGIIDWNALHLGHHLDWIGIRATQGVDFVDPKFVANRREAAWVPRRAPYHFLTAPSKLAGMVPALRKAFAVQQARHFCSVVGKLKPGEHLVIDAEGDGITVDMVVAFAEFCETTYGRPCVAVYTGVFVAGGALWHSTEIFNGKRVRILAGYVPEVKARALAAPYWCAIWQDTSSATFPGIIGHVDHDRIDDPKAIDAICGLIPIPPFDPANRKFGLWPNATDKPVLAKGASGDAVRYLQGAMRALAQDVPITGVFDARTVQAVLDRQRAHGLVPTGTTTAGLWAQLDRQLLATPGACQ